MLLVAAGLILAGCSTADSKDIRTSGIKADLRVTVKDHERRADVLATLRAGTLTYVKLGSGESITTAASGASVQLGVNKMLGVTNYSGRLDGDLTAGTEVTFDLQRDGDNESAPHSTVFLPERLQLIAPAVGTTASRSSSITVRIDSAPADQPTTVSWNGQCVQAGEIQLPSGVTIAQIPAGRIRQLAATASPGQRNTNSCTITLTAYRRTTGSLDPAFKEGSIVAEAQSSRNITSIS